MSKKIFFIAFLCCFGFANAQQVVNGIAVIINNEPVTMHEVYKVAKQFNTDEKNALNLLIRDRLETAQIKNLKIEASSYEVSQKLEKIAAENGVSKENLRSFILSKGGDYTQFREDIEKSIKQEKLYQSIFSEAKIKVTPSMARAYFSQNQSQFSQFERVKAIHYVAQSKEILQSIKTSPMSQNTNVRTQSIDLKGSELPAGLRAVFSQTQDGSFTQIFQTQNGFEMFFVEQKIGQVTANFEDVENEAMNAVYKLEQDRVVNEYFNKLRAKANIKVLR
ncbi:MAG: peptidylprolyl isomerase [Campylobacter sp.]